LGDWQGRRNGHRDRPIGIAKRIVINRPVDSNIQTFKQFQMDKGFQDSTRWVILSLLNNVCYTYIYITDLIYITFI
jgi:hypothetical protein